MILLIPSKNTDENMQPSFIVVSLENALQYGVVTANSGDCSTTGDTIDEAVEKLLKSTGCEFDVVDYDSLSMGIDAYFIDSAIQNNQNLP